jgi:hypothetical protein
MYDVSTKNLGHDITSLDLASGELHLIEVISCSQPGPEGGTRAMVGMHGSIRMLASPSCARKRATARDAGPNCWE